MLDAIQSALLAQLDQWGETVAYRVKTAVGPVNLQAIVRRGLIDGVETNRHSRLTIMPGARVNDADTLHLPNGASEKGDTVTIDGVEARVIEVARRRGGFTRVSIQNV